MSENKEYRDQSILVLIPALNEEEGIRLTIGDLRQYLTDSKFLVVDGNSKDQTAQVARGLNADVIFQNGIGKGNGIQYALGQIKDNFGYLVFIDGDYTYPAERIPYMISILDENSHVGMVCGNRFNHHYSLDSMNDVFYFGNRVLAFIHTLFNGVELRDPLTGLRIIRWSIVKDWKPKSKGFDIEVEMNHYVERQGYDIVEIDIPYRTRVGEKKLRLGDGITILKRILSESLH